MPVRSDAWHRNIFIAQLLAYIFMVGMVIYVISADRAENRERIFNEQVNDQERCQAGQDTRRSIRAIVSAIEDLGRELIIDGDETTPTPEQQAALDQFARFKEEQFANLPIPRCENGKSVYPDKPGEEEETP